MPRSLSPVVLPGDPSAALHSTTKQYLDAQLAAFSAPATSVPVPGPSPASILNIGTRLGQNHFSAQLARLGDANFFAKSTIDLAAGYEESPLLYAADALKTWVAYRVQVGAPTTGGSSYSRAEGREQGESGGDYNFDATDSNTHYIQGRFRIVHAPAVLPDIVCVQLHNGSADRISIRTQLVSGTWRLRIRFNGSTVTLDAGGTDIATGISNIQGLDWNYRVQTINGLPTVWVGLASDPNSLITPKYTGATAFTSTGSSSWYQKYGCYLQTTTATDSASDYGEVWHHQSLTHWHTGWATPAPFYPVAKHAAVHAPGGYDDLSGLYVSNARLDVNNGIPVLTGSVLPRKYQQYATSTLDGTIVLTGDLGGSATAPTVPGLASKAALVHTHDGADIATGTVAVGQLPTNTASGIPQLDSSGFIPTALQYGTSTSTYGIIRLSGDLTGTAGNPTLVGNTVRAYSGTATSLADTDGVVICTPTTGICTATLPTPVGRTGKRFVVKKAYGATGYPVSLATAAGTIDGQSTEVIMVAGGFREVISDGANWHIVGGTVVPVIYSPSAPANGATVNVDATMASVFRFTPGVSGFILGNPTNGVEGLQINIEIYPTTAFSVTITGPALTTGQASPYAIVGGRKGFIGMRYSGGTWYVIAMTQQL